MTAMEFSKAQANPGTQLANWITGSGSDFNPLALNTLAGQFREVTHEMNMRAGDASVRIQQDLAQEGNVTPPPSLGGNAGTILTEEIKRSAITENPSELVGAYNKANDDYKRYNSQS